MLIAHISDTHLAGKDRLTCDVAPMGQNLQKCIDYLNQLEPRPDVVLHTGDVADGASAEQYDQAKNLLQQLEMPLFIVPGNHDSRQGIMKTFAPASCTAIENGFVCYVIDEFDIVLIGLDSTRKGSPGGEFCAAREKWLKPQLEKYKDRPIILFMHHPPMKMSVLETDEDGFEGVDRLAQLVAGHPQITRVLCGHIHLASHALWAGAQVSVAPSMGMQLGFDLTMQKPSEFFLDAPGFLLHHLTPQNNLITHHRQLRALKGPYSFDGNCAISSGSKS